MRLPEPALPEARAAAGRGWSGRSTCARTAWRACGHAAGRSYPDLVRLRAGDASGAPDAVVLPGPREEVAAMLAACADERVAVVPFGGGTSVVGGVEPLRGGLRRRDRLDLAGMDALAAWTERR